MRIVFGYVFFMTAFIFPVVCLLQCAFVYLVYTITGKDKLFKTTIDFRIFYVIISIIYIVIFAGGVAWILKLIHIIYAVLYLAVYGVLLVLDIYFISEIRQEDVEGLSTDRFGVYLRFHQEKNNLVFSPRKPAILSFLLSILLVVIMLVLDLSGLLA